MLLQRLQSSNPAVLKAVAAGVTNVASTDAGAAALVGKGAVAALVRSLLWPTCSSGPVLRMVAMMCMLWNGKRPGCRTLHKGQEPRLASHDAVGRLLCVLSPAGSPAVQPCPSMRAGALLSSRVFACTAGRFASSAASHPTGRCIPVAPCPHPQEEGSSPLTLG